ncbi:hypothetical protein BIW11_02850, partial [Tropilaelaps mercedesae]
MIILSTLSFAVFLARRLRFSAFHTALAQPRSYISLVQNVFRELRTPGRRYRRLPSADMEEDVSDVQTKHENNESLASPVDTVASLDMSFKRMLEQEPRCAREPAVNLMNDYVIVESRTSHADPVFKVVDSDIPHDSFTDNRPISPLSPSISSDDDDDVWTVSVEAPKPTSGTSVLPRSSTKTNRRLHRAKQNRYICSANIVELKFAGPTSQRVIGPPPLL